METADDKAFCNRRLSAIQTQNDKVCWGRLCWQAAWACDVVLSIENSMVLQLDTPHKALRSVAANTAHQPGAR